MARQDTKRALKPLTYFLGRDEETPAPVTQSNDEMIAAMRTWAAMTQEGGA